MMTRITVRRSKALKGTCRVPGDKSISHRAVMLAGLAHGVSRISGFLNGGDCHATIGVMRALGVGVETVSPSEIVIHGCGKSGLVAPQKALDCDNSGTTMRLMAGILVGQPFSAELTGTLQLKSRPMSRIIKPLKMMGADIVGDNDTAPLFINGRRDVQAQLRGIQYRMPVSSAQVKSCILLAGLNAVSTTRIIEKGPSRDHTERMMGAMGAGISIGSPEISIDPLEKPLQAMDIRVPGDISSAAFIMVAACIIPHSSIRIEKVGVNPTRTGIIDALQQMGASITLENYGEMCGEPVADIVVKYCPLQGTSISQDLVVRMIDEIPIFAVAATHAHGATNILDASELRVKETDRIATTANQLSRLGAQITPNEDGMIITGGTRLESCVVHSCGDHRLAMMLTIAGLVAKGETTVEHAQVTADSFPGFETCLSALGAPIEVGP
jgi:3-phosphoshikimate 1-carboxyvinyltransferase